MIINPYYINESDVWGREKKKKNTKHFLSFYATLTMGLALYKIQRDSTDACRNGIDFGHKNRSPSLEIYLSTSKFA